MAVSACAGAHAHRWHHHQTSHYLASHAFLLMRGEGPGKYALEERPKPSIQHPTGTHCALHALQGFNSRQQIVESLLPFTLAHIWEEHSKACTAPRRRTVTIFAQRHAKRVPRRLPCDKGLCYLTLQSSCACKENNVWFSEEAPELTHLNGFQTRCSHQMTWSNSPDTFNANHDPACSICLNLIPCRALPLMAAHVPCQENCCAGRSLRPVSTCLGHQLSFLSAQHFACDARAHADLRLAMLCGLHDSAWH